MAVAAHQNAAFLFGDSITQACTAGSLSQRMSEFYMRRLDVINRGFGGYNTEWAIPVLETVFPKKDQREKGCAQQVPIMTIWFGANDAVLPGGIQHVPLDKYKSNLSKLVSIVKSPSSPWHSPETRIVLITAPPTIPAGWLEHCKSMWRQNGSKGPEPTENDRDPKVTKQYVDGCIEVAKMEGVEVVSAWDAIVQAAGGDDAESLAPYFYDGLHLTSDGYKAVTDSLTSLIVATWPELNPERMEMPTPHWALVDPQNPRGILGPRSAANGVKDEL